MDQSKHHVTAPEDRVPFFQKFIYSMGSLANDSQAAFIGPMIIILNLGLGVNPLVVGLIGFFPRIFDAVLDPIIGYSSDNARTRWGRRRPFIFFGAIAAGICYALMFQLHKGHSEIYYIWYVLIFQVLFFAGFTCYSIPWIALGYEMTPDYHERTRLQSFSKIFAQIPWLIAPWCWIIMYNKNWFPDPETGGADVVYGARVLAIIIGACIISFGILPAIFNKEHFANLPKPKKVTGDFIKNLINDVQSELATKLIIIFTILTSIGSFFIDLTQYSLLNQIFAIIFTILLEVSIFLLLYAIPMLRKLFNNVAISFKNKLFVKLCAITFLIFNGFMLSSTFIAYVIFFYVFKHIGSLDMAYSSGGKLLGFYGTFSAICTIGVVALIPWLSRKLGKRNTFFVTIPISIVGYALKWIGYNQGQPYLLLMCAPFITFGLGSLFTLTLSMVADVCDIDELETGERREGMFSAIYWFMVKIGLGFAGFVGGALLMGTGFKQEVGLAQPDETLLWMRIFDVLIPIVTSVIALFIIKTIDISEEKAHDVRKQLEERRGKA